MLREYGHPLDPVGSVSSGMLFLLEPVVMAPGFAGPIQRLAFAEFPGRGYENPMPGSITGIQQDGGKPSPCASQRPEPASSRGSACWRPVLAPVVPSCRVASGVSTGQRPAASLATGAADTAPASAASSSLTRSSSRRGSSRALTYGRVGPDSRALRYCSCRDAVVAVSGSGANARVIWRATSGDAVDVNFDATVVLTGGIGGATQAPTAVLQHARLADAANTEAWRMLDWEDDWGLTVTNVESPEAGRLDILDAIGRERKIFRAAGEDDDHYRERVGQIADTVSPGAVMRAINRILAPFGLSACL